MIRINLLPFRAARKKENIRRQVSIFILLLTFVGIILVWYNFNLGNKTDELETQIKGAKKELEAYKEINKEITDIKNKLKTLKAKKKVIDELEQSRREPVRMLDSMTELVIPKRMWFTTFQVDEKVSSAPAKVKSRRGKKKKEPEPEVQVEKTIEVRIKGIALDNKTVADFMTQLEKSPMYSNINLKSLQQVVIKDVNLKEFELSFIKVPPKPPEGAQEDKVVEKKKPGRGGAKG